MARTYSKERVKEAKKEVKRLKSKVITWQVHTEIAYWNAIILIDKRQGEIEKLREKLMDIRNSKEYDRVQNIIYKKQAHIFEIMDRQRIG